MDCTEIPVRIKMAGIKYQQLFVNFSHYIPCILPPAILISAGLSSNLNQTPGSHGCIPCPGIGARMSILAANTGAWGGFNADI